MPIKGMTQAEIDEATRAQVASGAKSTDRVNRLEGETASEANARITAGYKEMTAKPIPSKAQTDAGMYVNYVRTEKGGVGQYQALKPVGYTGPNDKITKWTPGVIPANIKRTTGTSIGYNPDDYKTEEDLQRLAAKVSRGGKLTIDEQAFMNRGVKPATTSSTSTTKVVDPLAGKTPDQIAAYNNAKATAQQFVDLYGGQLTDYFDTTTGKVTSPSKDVVDKKFATPKVPKFGDPDYVAPAADVNPTADPTSSSTNITVLKSLLKGMGFNSGIIDSSSSFLMSLLSEGLDYDNAVSIFLDSKDYTLKSGVKVISPFYEQYGYLNEGLTNAKSASELYNFVEGSKGIIEKYGLSSKFLSQDSLKKYVKNNVTAKDLDERANAARLKAINADPAYVQSLKMLGYLGSSSDLTDFYLDPAIGKEKLESNRNTGAFTAEALRRANSGIKTDREDLMRFERLTAGLQAKGLNEAQISQTASEGFQNIANNLQPSLSLSNIFEGNKAATIQTIQTELESEQFLGLESSRRKKLKELGTNIFNQSTGKSTGRTTTNSNYSSAGQI